jgi:hypothetical protein
MNRLRLVHGRCRFLACLGTVAAAVSVGACSSIGPMTVPRDRLEYSTSVGESWKQQTLLNIVKLRYGDIPTFLEVTQVVAGYQVQTVIGGSVSAGNSNASLVGPFVIGGTASAANTYIDHPTIIYAPLTGVDFIKKLMTPIQPSAVLFMLQSGYSASQIFPIVLDSINGLDNASGRLKRPADPRFLRLTTLMREGQLAGAVQVRIEHPKEGPETSLVVFGTKQDQELTAKSQEIRALLGLKPDTTELKVYYGGYSGKDDEIDMATRSMLQIMVEFAAMIRVPESDVTSKRATPGLTDSAKAAPSGALPMNILVGDKRPRDAHVAVENKGRWFWIADDDVQSKVTFTALMLLFSIADTGVKGSGPVVTIPAQ